MTASSPRTAAPGTGTVSPPTSRTQQILLALATVAYVAAAAMLAVADVPLSNRVALVQTLALFACGVLIVRRTDTPIIGWLLIVPGVTFNFIYDGAGFDIDVGVTDAAVLLDALPSLGVLALGLLLLVFPSGRLESSIARVAAWFFVVVQVGNIPVGPLASAGIVDIDPGAVWCWHLRDGLTRIPADRQPSAVGRQQAGGLPLGDRVRSLATVGRGTAPPTTRLATLAGTTSSREALTPRSDGRRGTARAVERGEGQVGLADSSRRAAFRWSRCVAARRPARRRRSGTTRRPPAQPAPGR